MLKLNKINLKLHEFENRYKKKVNKSDKISSSSDDLASSNFEASEKKPVNGVEGIQLVDKFAIRENAKTSTDILELEEVKTNFNRVVANGHLEKTLPKTLKKLNVKSQPTKSKTFDILENIRLISLDDSPDESKSSVASRKKSSADKIVTKANILENGKHRRTEKPSRQSSLNSSNSDIKVKSDGRSTDKGPKKTENLENGVTGRSGQLPFFNSFESDIKVNNINTDRIVSKAKILENGDTLRPGQQRSISSLVSDIKVHDISIDRTPGKSNILQQGVTVKFSKRRSFNALEDDIKTSSDDSNIRAEPKGEPSPDGSSVKSDIVEELPSPVSDIPEEILTVYSSDSHLSGIPEIKTDPKNISPRRGSAAANYNYSSEFDDISNGGQPKGKRPKKVRSKRIPLKSDDKFHEKHVEYKDTTSVNSSELDQTESLSRAVVIVEEDSKQLTSGSESEITPREATPLQLNSHSPSNCSNSKDDDQNRNVSPHIENVRQNAAPMIERSQSETISSENVEFTDSKKNSERSVSKSQFSENRKLKCHKNIAERASSGGSQASDNLESSGRDRVSGDSSGAKRTGVHFKSTESSKAVPDNFDVRRKLKVSKNVQHEKHRKQRDKKSRSVSVSSESESEKLNNNSDSRRRTRVKILKTACTEVKPRKKPPKIGSTALKEETRESSKRNPDIERIKNDISSDSDMKFNNKTGKCVKSRQHASAPKKYLEEKGSPNSKSVNTQTSPQVVSFVEPQAENSHKSLFEGSFTTNQKNVCSCCAKNEAHLCNPMNSVACGTNVVKLEAVMNHLLLGQLKFIQNMVEKQNQSHKLNRQIIQQMNLSKHKCL